MKVAVREQVNENGEADFCGLLTWDLRAFIDFIDHPRNLIVAHDIDRC